nr:flagellar transcriptional regulator FlhD [Parahaliea mediterranea]
MSVSENNVDLVEIQDLNLSYLLIAQRLLKEDYTMALMRLKVDDETGRLLLSLSAKQLGRLARTNQLLFRFCISDASHLSQLTQNERSQGMDLMHTSLLMASLPPSSALNTVEGV